MRILVLNSGSSSLKFRVMEILSATLGADDAPRTIVGGAVTGIGGEATLRVSGMQEAASPQRQSIADHEHAVHWILKQVNKADIDAVGHRLVHGGERFRQPVLLDDAVLHDIERQNELAPLHNPPGTKTIRAAQAFFSRHLPMVAVFDTGFHATMPAVASTYAIPATLAARYSIRRYGFHGIAHASLAAGYAACTGRSLIETRLISLQLGNGCSATAIRSGRSVDTSMGFTPLEGLVMGTRSGDLDPALVSYLARREGVGAEIVEQWLNEDSGLLGLSGLSNDVRVLLEAEENHDTHAALALNLFCYRVRKYLGAYLSVLGGADAVLFGGGIGEHAPVLRARIVEAMDWCGIHLDQHRNNAATDLHPGGGVRISSDDAGIEVYVIGVDEELIIARETVRCLSGIRHEDE